MNTARIRWSSAVSAWQRVRVDVLGLAYGWGVVRAHLLSREHDAADDEAYARSTSRAPESAGSRASWRAGSARAGSAVGRARRVRPPTGVGRRRTGSGCLEMGPNRLENAI